ncbi:MAG: ComEC/Rec2 family competence protein [Eubacterium sp.]|nr:ComEC/Rec2 family competence protein [Eubacterium sp.]
MKRVFAFIGFSCAITLFILNSFAYNAYLYVLLVCVILFALSLIIKPLRQEKVVPTVLGSAVFACLIFTLTMSGVNTEHNALCGKTAACSFKIIEPYEMTTTGKYSYTVKTEYIKCENSPQNIKVRLFSDDIINADYYDEINGELTFLDSTEKPLNSNGMYSQGVYISAVLDSAEVKPCQSKPPYYYVLKLRQHIKSVLENSFEDQTGALSCALILGDRSLLTDDTVNDFIVSGASHLMAVSGLHIGMLYLAVFYLLYPLKNKRFLGDIICLLAVLFYLSLTGFSKSAIRAGIMLLIIIISKMSDKQPDTLNSLGFASFVICLNPFSAADAGAVLTVLALLGLLVIKPELRSEKIKSRVLGYIINVFISTISILLATLPAMWIYFGRVSLISLLINIVAIPLTQLALLFLFLFTVLFHISPVISYIPYLVSNYSLKALLSVVHFFSEKLSTLYISIDSSILALSIAFALIFIGVSTILLKNPDRRLIAWLCVLIISVGGALNIYETKTTTTLTVTRDGAVIVEDGGYVTAVGVSSSRDFYLYNRLKTNSESALLAEDEGEYENGNIRLINDSEKSYLFIYNNVFEISQDYVTINNISLIRDINHKFSQSADNVFYIKNSQQIYLRRVESG